MTTREHAHLVTAQFGPRAAAYVGSVVHATGDDLDHLASLAKQLSPARVLDLGCGGGHASFAVAPCAGQVVAYDMSVEMLNAVALTAADKGLRTIVTRQGIAEKLPFPDRSFDMVISRFSAHHWQNVAQALREARRVIKDDGLAVFIDTIAPQEPLCDTHMQTIELLRDTSHVRNYSSHQWLALLRGAGFAPGEPTTRRLRLEFDVWIARMGPPDVHVQAIRSLQAGMPREVADYLALEADGSFTIESATFAATPA